MKILKIITAILFCLIAFSCKKDKTDNVSKEALTILKNIANSNDELIATYYDTDKSSTSYIYGSTNGEGRGIIAKSVVYKVKGNDTMINVILDSNLRPSIYYLSTSSGEKLNKLCKFDYVDGDSIKVSFYNYNWLNSTDSLIAQYVTKGNNGRVLYGARASSINSEIDAWFTAAGVGMVIIGVLCPVAAGYAVASLLSTGSTLSTFGAVAGAFTTIGVHLLAWSGSAHAATLSTNIPVAPISPTSVSAIIPNPTGTPQNPGGIVSSTVTDIDGNIYHTVIIGTQTWLVENLKTSRYNDGSAVSTDLDNATWQSTTSGAYANYDNTTYGNLYNWYAVSTGKLAPAGWHVASDAEWTILTNYLGGESTAGGKLKEESLTYWNSPNTGATNSTGFTALPGGNRSFTGTYQDVHIEGYFWTSTQFDAAMAIDRALGYGISSIGSFTPDKNFGFSVRCIKD